jgi:hypothetical protein
MHCKNKTITKNTNEYFSFSILEFTNSSIYKLVYKFVQCKNIAKIMQDKLNHVVVIPDHDGAELENKLMGVMVYF